MSPSESPANASDGSDPSVEVNASDVEANVSEEDPEEEEVEEEEEAEEEEEDEEEEADGEEVEEVADSPVDADKNHRRVSVHSSQRMESEGQEGNVRQVSSVTENLKVKLPSGPSCEVLAVKKEVTPTHENSSSSYSRKNLATSEVDRSEGFGANSETNGSLVQNKTSGRYSVPSCDSRAYLCGVRDIDCGTSKSSNDAGKDVATDFLQRDCFDDDSNGGQDSISQIRQSETKSGDDAKHITGRFIAPDTRMRSLSPGAEIKDGNKRPAIVCDFFAKGWCIKGSSCRFLHIKDHVSSGMQANGDSVTAKLKREVQMEEGVKDNAERSRDSLFPENRYTLSMSSNYLSPNLTSYPNHAEGKASTGNHLMYDKYISPIMKYASPVMTNSPNLPLFSSSGVPLHPVGHKSKMSSYDWQPSVPFQPSFFITPTSISLPRDQYDPLRDSVVEIPNLGDGSLKASFVIRGPSIQALSQVQTNGESAIAGNQGVDCNDEKSSVSSHNRFPVNHANKDCNHGEKDFLATEIATTARSYLKCQNSKVGMEENTFIAEGIADIDKERIEHNARHHDEGLGYKEKVMDWDGKGNEMDVDHQMDGNLQKESKAVKNFRVVLVDVVKDLLKPKWHEGHLSKDAHNLIVKKSVEKILNTLQPHQIPITADNVKHFVSTSQQKISKLVNGYVDKYGK